MAHSITNLKGAPRLRLRVTASAETILRKGHPWLFKESIRESNRAGELGELAVIYDRKDTFLAVGLYDPESPIRVRILHAGNPVSVDTAWWRMRLEKALEIRHGLFDAHTTGWRCLNGESDGWPGLVVDCYGSTLVLKLYTAAWLPRLAEIVELLNEKLPNERIVLRLSRNIQKIAGERFKKSEGEILRGKAFLDPVIFLETGLRFEADVLRGQKTGFFLDQRENRRRVESLSSGRRALNAFSFSGGFSLYAARGGAAAVTDLDISGHALSASRRNFLLNESVPAIARCAHDLIQADAFEWMRTARGRKFDLIVLDPPSFAKRESERERAIHAYERLAALGISLLETGGVLLAASCSAHVTNDEFFTAVRAAAGSSGRQFTELRTMGHAADHPARFKEANYLKSIYLEMGASTPEVRMRR